MLLNNTSEGKAAPKVAASFHLSYSAALGMFATVGPTQAVIVGLYQPLCIDLPCVSVGFSGL